MSSFPPAFGNASRSRALVALRHRNFRLYVPGQALSMIGSAIMSLALPWAAYASAHAVLAVGITLAAQYAPMIGGGAFAERFFLRLVPRRRLLVGSQTLCCFIATALATIAWFGATSIWALVLLSALWGVTRACENPARQRFLVDMVGRRDLTHAVSLTASAWNGATVVGAALAGVLLTLVGQWAAFAAVGAGMLGGAIGLAFLDDLPGVVQLSRSAGRAGSRWQALSVPSTQALIALGCAASALGMNRLTVMPVLATEVLGSGALGFGLSMAALGLGAAVGTALLLWQASAVLERSHLWFGVGWAITLALFGWSRWTAVTALLLGCGGVLQTWFLATVSHRLQRLVPDPKRGPLLMSYARWVMLTTAFGPLQAGLLGWAIGVPLTVSVDAFAVAAVAIVVGVGWSREVAAPTDQTSSSAAP